jgi:hypothetical protein
MSRKFPPLILVLQVCVLIFAAYTIANELVSCTRSGLSSNKDDTVKLPKISILGEPIPLKEYQIRIDSVETKSFTAYPGEGRTQPYKNINYKLYFYKSRLRSSLY